jgi:hypothetical protein
MMSVFVEAVEFPWFILPSRRLRSSSPALTSLMALALAVTWI